MTFDPSRFSSLTVAWAKATLASRGLQFDAPIVDLIDELTEAVEEHVGTPADFDDAAWDRISLRGDALACEVAERWWISPSAQILKRAQALDRAGISAVASDFYAACEGIPSRIVDADVQRLLQSGQLRTVGAGFYRPSR